jgi:hypothetical protein
MKPPRGSRPKINLTKKFVEDSIRSLQEEDSFASVTLIRHPDLVKSEIYII